MMRHRPALIHRLTADAIKLWEDGHIRAAKPTKVMTFSQVEEALRVLQSGKGMGKIILVPRPDDVVPVVPTQQPPYTFRPDASYVISGGLGGIGRSVSLWMAERGARNIILLSRSGIVTEEAGATLKALKDTGCSAHVFTCDVSDEARLTQVLDECKSTLPPVRGLIQGAMTLEVSNHYWLFKCTLLTRHHHSSRTSCSRT
jgi:hypothetical protein